MHTSVGRALIRELSKCKGPEVRVCRVFGAQEEATYLTSKKDHCPCCAEERLIGGRDMKLQNR